MTFITTHRRLLASLFLVVVPLLTLLVANGLAQKRLAGAMVDSASRFLASLSPEQRARLNYAFGGNKERFNWHYIPRIRKGLALREMTPAQKALAIDLLKTGVSTEGFETVRKIWSLEPVLIEREIAAGLPMMRDPEGYYVVVFGTPSADKPWGWRVEGHHVSLNITVVGGRVQDEVVSNTPLFFGTEPAVVQGGPMKGLRPLPGVEDKAHAVITALDATQRSLAIIAKEVPIDIFTGNSRGPDLGAQLNPMALARQPSIPAVEGLGASRMTADQKRLLRALIDDYMSRMPDEISTRRAREITAEFDEIHFAWIGGTSPADGAKPVRGLGCEPNDTRWVCEPLGYPYYYRVQGPSFLIEYMNTTGNHSHSLWRDFKDGDFGEDLLREHYAMVPHEAAPATQQARQ